MTKKKTVPLSTTITKEARTYLEELSLSLVGQVRINVAIQYLIERHKKEKKDETGEISDISNSSNISK